jgi:hypothetical protein
MASTAIATPVRTAAWAEEAPIAKPPAAEPHAMPTLTAEAGSDEANWPPGPARLTTRCWSEGAIPMPNRPMATSASAAKNAIPPRR